MISSTGNLFAQCKWSYNKYMPSPSRMDGSGDLYFDFVLAKMFETQKPSLRMSFKSLGHVSPLKCSISRQQRAVSQSGRQGSRSFYGRLRTSRRLSPYHVQVPHIYFVCNLKFCLKIESPRRYNKII